MEGEPAHDPVVDAITPQLEHPSAASRGIHTMKGGCDVIFRALTSDTGACLPRIARPFPPIDAPSQHTDDPRALTRQRE
jgi:hypothetical protein